jgi:hypothetical protein
MLNLGKNCMQMVEKEIVKFMVAEGKQIAHTKKVSFKREWVQTKVDFF